MGTGTVIACLAVGPLLAVALLVGVWRQPGQRASTAWGACLVLLALGAPAYSWASFGPGIALADTYVIAGGDHSPWTAPLCLVSGLAALALLGQVVWNRSHRH